MIQVSQRGADKANMTTWVFRVLRSIAWVVVLGLVGTACGTAAVAPGEQLASTDATLDLGLLVTDAEQSAGAKTATAVELSSRIALPDRWVPGAAVPSAEPSAALPEFDDGRVEWCQAKLSRFSSATQRSTREWVPSDGADRYRLWIETASHETDRAAAAEATLFAQELLECSGFDLAYDADLGSPEPYRHETRQVGGLDAQVTTFSTTGVTTLHTLIAVGRVTFEVWLSGIETVDWAVAEGDLADALAGALAALSGVSDL